MDSIQKWRKTKQPAPGFIPYGMFSGRENETGLVYSLDKFRPRFPLCWQNLVLSSNGEFVKPTDALVLEAVRNFLRGFSSEFEFSPDNHGAGRGGNLHWWRYNGGIITLHKFKPFGCVDFNYSLLFEFNPNKTDLAAWRDIIAALSAGYGDRFCWSNTRMDYALDIPFPISDVRLLTRKVGSSYQGTYYFGTRGSSGYTRVYDKRKEILDKQRLDIGQDVTRIEWESRSGDPLHMDYPYLIRDLGRYEVLRYVPMHDWPAALRTFDERTALKIRQSMMPISVDESIFRVLANGLLDYLGLYERDNVDHLDKKRLDQSESEDLERIQSQLRKWAKVDH